MAARAAHGGATAEAAAKAAGLLTAETTAHLGRLLTAEAVFRYLFVKNRGIFFVNAALQGRQTCGAVFYMHRVLFLPHIGDTFIIILFSLHDGRISFRRGICYGRSVLIRELSGLWFQWCASNACISSPVRL